MLFWSATVVVLPGCMFAPVTDFNNAMAENRALRDQNRAQLAEIQNLKTHNKDVENRVIRSEEQLAALQNRTDLDENQIDEYRRERDGLYSQCKGIAQNGNRLPPELIRQFADLSRRYPSLQFDPETGVSKLDTDILFDSGKAELRPGADQLVAEFARVLQSPAAADLKIMVVGHTDSQQIAGREVREKYSDNFHLSTARALAVADVLKQAGLSERQIAVTGLGSHQPVATNTTAQERRKNRRVEIFVMTPETPIVGWVDSTTTKVY
jgi:chemotaxis protein MotB